MSTKSAVIRLLGADDEPLELGSVTVPAEDRGYLRAIAALAPTVSAVEFFVRLRLHLGTERAKRVVRYLMDHAEVVEVRESFCAPKKCKLRIVEENNE